MLGRTVVSPLLANTNIPQQSETTDFRPAALEPTSEADRATQVLLRVFTVTSVWSFGSDVQEVLVAAKETQCLQGMRVKRFAKLFLKQRAPNSRGGGWGGGVSPPSSELDARQQPFFGPRDSLPPSTSM